MTKFYKKIIKVMLIIAILLICTGSVSAEGNFTALQNEIDNSGNVLEISQDYTFNNATDIYLMEGVILNAKENFTLNGNGHIINGANLSSIFTIAADNIVINNLTLINGVSMSGSAVSATGENITLNNIIFINNHADFKGGAVSCSMDMTINNSKFIDNTATDEGSSVAITNEGILRLNNCSFSNSQNISKSLVYSQDSTLYINNCVFANTTSKYAAAIFNNKRAYIINSTFINLSASLTGGALLFKNYDVVEIRNSTFINIHAQNDGGSIFADTNPAVVKDSSLSIYNSKFINSSANYGGAICGLNTEMRVENSTFLNNTANYGGGAIHVSSSDLSIYDTSFIQNNAIDDEMGSYGGAIYYDYYKVLFVKNSTFIKNHAATHGDAIYMYQPYDAGIYNSKFRDNGEAIYSVYDDYYGEKDNDYGNDTVHLKQTDYETIVVENGLETKIINNTINYTDLPEKFDARDYGWVTPVKNQGEMGACWAFGTISALESALLKSTGIAYNLSENNLQNTILRYSKYGTSTQSEGGHLYNAIRYFTGWLGGFLSEYDEYDEYGKLSPLINTNENIHIQDVIIVPEFTDLLYQNDIKEAIINSGAVAAVFEAHTDNFDYYDPSTSTYYCPYILNNQYHVITIVGWDDNFPKENFSTTPEGNGAWICKNSWGTEWGKDGFFYISYYDKTLFRSESSIAFKIGNTENYTKNYQTEVGGTTVQEQFEYDKYYNRYTSLADDLIAGVGTYINEIGLNYTIDVFVNDILKLTQNETSKFIGFTTIKLNEYIPIKTGDNFTVRINGNPVPTVTNSRLVYEANNSFLYSNGEWKDLYLDKTTAVLKVYTVEFPIKTNDLVKIYKNESQFEANVGVENATVNFKINGVGYNRTTNKNGTAKLNINLNPGNYTITTTFNNLSVENSVCVISPIESNDLVKYYRNASQYVVRILGPDGNYVGAGENVTFNVNGVLYTRQTNASGHAKLNINLEPGEYIITADYKGCMQSNKITVLSVLNASDITMKYLDGTQFKASLVDGQGNIYPNQYIQFNINGMLYYRLTDSTGTAKLNIRLMPGEYIITSSYNGQNIANTIKITS